MPKDYIRAAKQRRKPCDSCPMMPSSEGCFSPEALKPTLVKNIADGYVHPCHDDDSFACAGCLSFIKQYEPGGLASKHVIAFALGAELYKEEMIEDLPVYESIDQMLEGHSLKSNIGRGLQKNKIGKQKKNSLK